MHRELKDGGLNFGILCLPRRLCVCIYIYVYVAGDIDRDIYIYIYIYIYMYYVFAEKALLVSSPTRVYEVPRSPKAKPSTHYLRTPVGLRM